MYIRYIFEMEINKFYGIWEFTFGLTLLNSSSSSSSCLYWIVDLWISISCFLPLRLGSVLLLTVLWSLSSVIFALVGSKFVQPLVNRDHEMNLLCKNGCKNTNNDLDFEHSFSSHDYNSNNNGNQSDASNHNSSYLFTR